MHSALSHAYMVLTKAHMDNCPIPSDELVHVLTELELALALKPRQCDVGDLSDQIGRWAEFADLYGKGKIARSGYNTSKIGPIAWLNTTYEEGREYASKKNFIAGGNVVDQVKCPDAH